MEHDTNQLANYIFERANDGPLAKAMAIQHPALFDAAAAWVKTVEAGKPRPSAEALPQIADMTAVQVAVFDNWPTGKRAPNYPNRYAMAVEVWTADPIKVKTHVKNNYQHKANVALMDKKTFGQWLSKMKKGNIINPLSDKYISELDSAYENMTDDLYFGVLCAKPFGGGTLYFDRQWMVVNLSGEKTVAILSINGETLGLAPFSACQANGKPLAGKVILQSRDDRSDFSANWSTRNQ